MTDLFDTLMAGGPIRHGAYIGGRWEPLDGARLPIVDPATEREVGEIATGDAADVGRAVAAARAAFPAYAALPAGERAAYLDRIRTRVLERAEEFAQAI